MYIVLFSPESSEQFEKAFPANKSAFERSLLWAQHIAEGSKIAVLCFSKNSKAVNAAIAGRDVFVVAQDSWNAAALLEKISGLAKDSAETCIVYADASSAFLDAPLAKKLIQTHSEYKAEYTFADGYPAGFAPEILDAGAAAIMAELCKTVAAVPASAAVSKDCIFDVIKSDVNSFEIETEIASRDYRLLRMNFLCDCRQNFLAAKNLAAALLEQGKAELLELDTTKIGEENVIAISDIAKNCADVLKTVPAFYNVQINAACKVKPPFTPYAEFFEKRCGGDILSTQKRLSFEQFEPLAQKIADFSPNAVVSLSLFGEAVLHNELPLFIEKIVSLGLTALVEIDGAALKDFCESESFKKISALNPRNKIIFIVLIDAFTQKTFSKLHSADLQSAIECTKRLAANFPETYAQFTRTTQNEDELESFYRAYSDKAGATGGKIIIQKYDNFCGALPSVKTADLAPVEREPCWHLRRDMEILFDGTVPLCREACVPSCSDSDFIGNALNSSLEEIWQKKNSVLKEHIQKCYNGRCGKCDEYYIFNF